MFTTEVLDAVNQAVDNKQSIAEIIAIVIGILLNTGKGNKLGQKILSYLNIVGMIINLVKKRKEAKKNDNDN